MILKYVLIEIKFTLHKNIFLKGIIQGFLVYFFCCAPTNLFSHPLVTTNLLSLWIYLFWIFHINRIIQYVCGLCV